MGRNYDNFPQGARGGDTRSPKKKNNTRPSIYYSKKEKGDYSLRFVEGGI